MSSQSAPSPTEELDKGIEALVPNEMRDLLKSCPAAARGVHNWLIRTAVRLHRYFQDKGDIADLLRKYSAHCGRDVREEEIWNAITDSERWLAEQKGKPVGLTSTPKWPERNEELIKTIVNAGPTLDELTASSPIRLTDETPCAEDIVATLFPPDSLVCLGKTQACFSTAPLGQVQQMELLRQMQFIVPSPMSARQGRTKSGEQSAHSLDNTGPRRFLVVEFDQGATDDQAALLYHLAQREALVLAVHSGGKSLHGWFVAKDREEAVLFDFMRYAVSLGGDRATWTKSQFVRIPNGQRDNGRRQRVLYFNAGVLEGIK